MTLRVPPNNLEAEQAVLSAMLTHPAVVVRVSNLLKPSDFYQTAHEAICAACFSLKDKTDLITVSEHLKKHDLLEKCGGQDYIVSLVEQGGLSAGVDNWCKIVKEASHRRQLINLCTDTIEGCFQEFEESAATLSGLKTGIRSIESENKAKIPTNKDLLRDIIADLEKEDRTVGILTGLKNIDDNLNGLEPKTTYLIIAESGVGKSALALNIADYVTLNYKGLVPYFTLESTNTALMRRRLAKHSQVALTRIRTRNLRHEGQWSDIVKAANTLSEPNLMLIDETQYQTVEDLIAFSESLAMDNKISLIVVDYIQLMSSRHRFTSKHLEVAYIAKLLTFMAKNLNVPIIIISQLGKDVEKRSNREPMLSDIKESGDIRNMVDNIISIYTSNPEDTQFYVKIKALKGKDTGRWTSWLYFNGNYQEFSDCEDQYEAPVRRGISFTKE